MKMSHVDKIWEAFVAAVCICSAVQRITNIMRTPPPTILPVRLTSDRTFVAYFGGNNAEESSEGVWEDNKHQPASFLPAFFAFIRSRLSQRSNPWIEENRIISLLPDLPQHAHSVCEGKTLLFCFGFGTICKNVTYPAWILYSFFLSLAILFATYIVCIARFQLCIHGGCTFQTVLEVLEDSFICPGCHHCKTRPPLPPHTLA